MIRFGDFNLSGIESNDDSLMYEGGKVELPIRYEVEKMLLEGRENVMFRRIVRVDGGDWDHPWGIGGRGESAVRMGNMLAVRQVKWYGGLRNRLVEECTSGVGLKKLREIGERVEEVAYRPLTVYQNGCLTRVGMKDGRMEELMGVDARYVREYLLKAKYGDEVPSGEKGAKDYIVHLGSGHAFIEYEEEGGGVMYGFYPKPDSLVALFMGEVEGEVEDDSHSVYEAYVTRGMRLRFSVSEEEFGRLEKYNKRIKEVCDAGVKDGGCPRYDMLRYNCIHFAMGGLKEIGVKGEVDEYVWFKDIFESHVGELGNTLFYGKIDGMMPWMKEAMSVGLVIFGVGDYMQMVGGMPYGVNKTMDYLLEEAGEGERSGSILRDMAIVMTGEKQELFGIEVIADVAEVSSGGRQLVGKLWEMGLYLKMLTMWVILVPMVGVWMLNFIKYLVSIVKVLVVERVEKERGVGEEEWERKKGELEGLLDRVGVGLKEYVKDYPMQARLKQYIKWNIEDFREDYEHAVEEGDYMGLNYIGEEIKHFVRKVVNKEWRGRFGLEFEEGVEGIMDSGVGIEEVKEEERGMDMDETVEQMGGALVCPVGGWNESLIRGIEGREMLRGIGN